VLLEHRGKTPHIHSSAYIAPTATICGDVSIGENSRILFGATLVAEGGPVEIGADCIIMENAVIRGTPGFPARLGNAILVGPHAYLTGCVVEDSVFLATGTTVFNGAHIGTKAEVRINGVVHIKTKLPSGSTVPIGWVAVGDPAQLFPPNEHDHIWALQEPLNFPRTVFGLERAPEGETIMPEMTTRYAHALGRHFEDRLLDPPWTQDESRG
jgi:carbonic anhydrase/acetyltransferase-like protein (isoleucine patch superfamily)